VFHLTGFRSYIIPWVSIPRADACKIDGRSPGQRHNKWDDREPFAWWVVMSFQWLRDPKTMTICWPLLRCLAAKQAVTRPSIPPSFIETSFVDCKFGQNVILSTLPEHDLVAPTSTCLPPASSARPLGRSLAGAGGSSLAALHLRVCYRKIPPAGVQPRCSFQPRPQPIPPRYLHSSYSFLDGFRIYHEPSACMIHLRQSINPQSGDTATTQPAQSHCHPYGEQSRAFQCLPESGYLRPPQGTPAYHPVCLVRTSFGVLDPSQTLQAGHTTPPRSPDRTSAGTKPRSGSSWPRS
jgi:hypothetical protein